MRFVRRLAALAMLVAVASLISCVGGSNTHPVASPISITLLPSADNVSVGQSVTVTANVYDQSQQGATWTLDPVDFGVLSNVTSTGVTYTAPTDFSVARKVTITATSVTNPLVSAAVQISVSPIIVSLLPLAPQTVNAGDQLNIIPNIQNDTTNGGVSWSMSPALGTLTGATPFTVTYVAPAVVSNPVTVTITAASIANPTATASLEITPFSSGAGPNVAAVRVDGGPVTGQVRPNAGFTSLTICNPGSQSACQTVDGILVDTGSYGLRILQSQIPLLKLPTFSDGQGNTLENCAAFPDGSYTWGPVAQADVNIGNETAPTALVQVIASGSPQVPSNCSNGGLDLNAPELLGANGILGIGPEPTDCTLNGKDFCDGSVEPSPPSLYYACPAKGCQLTDNSVVVPVAKQVTNPVALFGNDNNGVLLQLPPVTDPLVSIVGTLVFGIGTEPNNDLGSATPYTTDRNGHITTIFNNQILSASFIDSGSDALFFPGLMPVCAVSTEFYCPPGLRNLQAVNQGATQGNGALVFNVDNADTLFSSFTGYSVFGTLAGPNGTYGSCSNGVGACMFDWGLPFFYGRNVFTQIDGQRAPSGAPPGPWWAF